MRETLGLTRDLVTDSEDPQYGPETLVLIPVSQYQPQIPVLTLNHPQSCPWQQLGSCKWQPRDHHDPSASVNPPRATGGANRAPLDCWKRICHEFCREVGEGTPRTRGLNSAL